MTDNPDNIRPQNLTMEQTVNTAENKIVTEIRDMIEQSRLQVAATVNAGMTLMYWHIGERINREVLGGERADTANRLSRKSPGS